MRRLTKLEMYNAIVKKHPSLKALDIVGGWRYNGVTREELWNIFVEFKIKNKVNKEQKKMVEYEINMRIIKGCDDDDE